MDAQKEQSKRNRKRLSMIVQEIERRSGEDYDPEENRESEEHANSEKNEPTLLREAWQVITYMLPLFFLVLFIAVVIGHSEGWDFIQRCGDFWWLPFKAVF